MNSRYPRFGPDGRVAAGADIIIVGETPVGRGFEPQWYNSNILMVKGLDDKPHLIDPITKEDIPVDRNGPTYTRIRAGGNQWLGAVDRSPLFNVACSRLGQKAWLVEHNHDNNDHSLFLDGNQIIRGSVHNPRVEDGYVVWTQDGGANQRTWGRYPDGRIVKLHASGSVWEGSPVPVLTPTGPWMVVTTNTDIRIYPWGQTKGYIISTGEDMNFDIDAIWKDGAIRLVWSNHLGSMPVPSASIFLDSPRVELNITVPAINRKLWFGFFMFSPGPKAPGNSIVAVRRISGPQSQPFGVTAETAGVATGQVLGHWVTNEAVSGTGVEYIEAWAKRVYDAGYRPIAYWDARVWPRRPNLPKGSWVALQAYQLKTESSVQYEMSIRTEVNRIASWGYNVVFIPQCYVQLPPTLQTEDLRSIVPVAARVARDMPQIVAMFPFHASDGRRTGLEDHPEVKELWEDVGRTVLTPEFKPFVKDGLPAAEVFKGDYMKIYAKLKGKYIGVDPNVPTVVYADRAHGGAWEEIELDTRDNHFIARFKEANVQLSLIPDSRLETRPAGTDGPWERFFATTQPDGSNLMYRFEGGVLVQPTFEIEEA